MPIYTRGWQTPKPTQKMLDCIDWICQELGLPRKKLYEEDFEEARAFISVYIDRARSNQQYRNSEYRMSRRYPIDEPPRKKRQWHYGVDSGTLADMADSYGLYEDYNGGGRE